MSDKEITLNYIDKMSAALVSLWSLTNRVGISVIVLSFLLLALSVGWVSIDSKLSAAGLEVVLSGAALLIGGMALIVSLIVCLFCLQIRTTSMRREIVRLYGTIGYINENASDNLLGPFEGADVFTTLMSPFSTMQQSRRGLVNRYHMIVCLTVLFGVIIALPIAGEIAAVLRLATLVGWQEYRLWTPFILFPLLTIFAPIAYVFDERGM